MNGSWAEWFDCFYRQHVISSIASWSSCSMSWPCWEEGCPRKSRLGVPRPRVLPYPGIACLSALCVQMVMEGFLAYSHRVTRVQLHWWQGLPPRGLGYVSGSLSGWENKLSSTLEIMWVSVAIFLQERIQENLEHSRHLNCLKWHLTSSCCWGYFVPDQFPSLPCLLTLILTPESHAFFSESLDDLAIYI